MEKDGDQRENEQIGDQPGAGPTFWRQKSVLQHLKDYFLRQIFRSQELTRLVVLCLQDSLNSSMR